MAVRRATLALALTAGLAVAGIAVQASAATPAKTKSMSSSTTTTTMMKKGATTTTTRH